MAYVKVDGVLPPEIIGNFNVGNSSDAGLIQSIIDFFKNFALMSSTLLQYFPNLLIPMAIMGLSFSLIPAVMWPSVALIVKESKLGTAYGLMTMIQAVGLSGLNFLIGWANDFSGGYEMGLWIFSSLGFFGLLFAYLLKRNELSPNGHGLEEGESNKHE
jgi:MFS family permease